MDETLRLRHLDQQHVWHPFTAMTPYIEEDAPIISQADGFYLFDTTGKAYIDGHSSLWCNVHGHRVPELDLAITEQLQKVAHSTLLGIANTPSIELAAKLVELAPPGLTRVFYTDCGAAGVEAALKMAWQYHRQKAQPENRSLFACLQQSYHGDTVGAVSVGGIDQFHSLFGGMTFPSLRLPSPAAALAEGDHYRSFDDILAETESLIDQHAQELAGVVVEPLVQAAAGILVHPHGYLQALRKMTRDRGILLIADEIAVGFGRVGSMLACEQENVAPDILILSKGLTGGYLPLAATLATEEIFGAFDGLPSAGRTFYHGHTYTGNPLACAVALASLARIHSHGIIENARSIESEFQAMKQRWTQQPSSWWSHISAVRHRGTMVAIDLVQSKSLHQPFDRELRMGHQMTLACRKRGVILRNLGDTVVLYPAPGMPIPLIKQLIQVVEESFQEVLCGLHV